MIKWHPIIGIKKVLNWLKRFYKWVILAKYYFLSLLVLFLTILYLIYYGNYNPQLVSSILLILGLFIMMMQYISDVRQFAPDNSNSLKNIIKAFPRVKPRVKNLKAHLSIHSAVSDDVELQVDPPSNASVEELIKYVLGEIKGLRENQKSLINGTNEKINDLVNKLSGLSQAQKQTTQIINSTLTGHIVGGFDKSVFAITLTFCGILIQWLSQPPMLYK